MPPSVYPILLHLAVTPACGGTQASSTPEAAPPEAPAPAGQPEAEAAAAPAEPAPAPPPARVVAVGDLHADLPDALEVLSMAGLVDEAGRWAGGEAVLVQTGDTTDRGPDSKEVVELLMRLEGEAAAAGGQVVALLGNHEAMNLTGDWRYVNPEDVADFGSVEARAAAFGPEGGLGAWLRQRPAVARVGDTVYAHGGISERFVGLGLDGLNEAVRRSLLLDPRSPVMGEEGPLWYRGYLLAEEPIACAEAARVLEALGARRLVMGHTTQRTGEVAVRCGGAVLGIDVGLSTHYGDNRAILELVSGDARVLGPEGVRDLPDP